MLKKSVCKRCRIKELGSKGWNEWAECWFKPYYKNGRKTREGDTVCPYTILKRIGESIKRKAIARGTPAEKLLIKEGFVPIRNIQSSWPWPVKSKPPMWCPYKKEHIKRR